MTGFTAPTHGPTGTVTQPLATTDLATFMNTTATSAMQQPLSAAIGYVERRCGSILGGQRVFLAEQSTGSQRTFSPMWNARALALPIQGRDMASLDALVDPLGVDVTASLVAQDIDWNNATIVCPYMRRGVWAVTATTAREAYEAEALKEATLIIAKQLWETRRGHDARAAMAGATPPLLGFSVPERAKELMSDLLLMVAG